MEKKCWYDSFETLKTNCTGQTASLHTVSESSGDDDGLRNCCNSNSRTIWCLPQVKEQHAYFRGEEDKALIWLMVVNGPVMKSLNWP